MTEATNKRVTNHEGQSVPRILVVGAHFAQFAAAMDGVLTFAEFEEFEAHQRCGAAVDYFLGQGLTQKERERVCAASDLGPGSRVLRCPTPASYRETHKVSEDNRLVTSPRRLSPRSFELELVLSGKSEQLSDHQTGLHVSGLVLEEAGRQSFLAVTERYFVPEGESSDTYFAWIATQARYRRFAFPVPTVLRYRIAESDLSDRDRMRFTVDVRVFQVEDLVAEFEFAFSAYRKRALLAKEREVARECLASHFGGSPVAPPFETNVSLPQSTPISPPNAAKAGAEVRAACTEEVDQ